MFSSRGLDFISLCFLLVNSLPCACSISPLCLGADLTRFQACGLFPAEDHRQPCSMNTKGPHVANRQLIFRTQMADSIPARLLLHRFIRGVPLHLMRRQCLVRPATQPPPCAIELDRMIARNILWHPPIPGPRISNIN